MRYKVKPLEWKLREGYVDYIYGDHVPDCWTAQEVYGEYRIRQSGDGWELWSHSDDWGASLISKHQTADEAKEVAGEIRDGTVRQLIATLTDIEEGEDGNE